MSQELSPERATLARDVALDRLRRLTGAAVGTALVLSGIFAGVAASSTHARKAVRRPRVSRVVPRNASEPKLPPPRAPSVAAQAPAPPPAPPAAAPETAPPVVVSGGS